MFSVCPGEAHRAFLLQLRFCLLLEQLQQPLSASARQLPRGQPSLGDTGTDLVKGFCVRVLGERLGGHMYLCSDVMGSVLALHELLLQQIRAVAQVMVHEYSRNRYISQQAWELVKEKREELMPRVEDLGILCGECK